MLGDAIHAAKLALLQGALLALLREAGEGEEINDKPDSIRVTLDAVGVEVEYYRGTHCVGGEGL